MLFKAGILDGIARGEIDLAFRRWARPAIKEGTRLRTSIGSIVIGSVEPINIDRLNTQDARRAGFTDVTALMDDLQAAPSNIVYRIALTGVEPDERIARRNEGLTTTEATDLIALLTRWDKNAPIDNYHTRILRFISEHPGIAAAELAMKLGVEKLKFKRDVRKLKELGLTISLDIGYKLSPRGGKLLEEMQ